jgi:beta-N-acetylhexosaminidase
VKAGLALLLAGALLAACSAGPTVTASPSIAPTAGASPTPTAAPPTGTPAPTEPGPTLQQLIGQKLIVRMAGTTPSADLLGRVQRGEIGGVILFGLNITTKTALVVLTDKLQAAARAGGQPPLLIALDQEGGGVKRVPWAPPTLSAPEMGRQGKASVARAQGESTGAALHDLGINVDLAPVADVPVSSGSFMYSAGRTWSFDAARTAALADAFAAGLEAEGVLPAMKHFPGIGLVKSNTDRTIVTLSQSADAFADGLLPYRTAIGHGIPMIMLSNVTYDAWDSEDPAGWSAAISIGLLRDELGFTGVTITDSLNGTAHARGLPAATVATRAAAAGTDLLMITSMEAASQVVYEKLLDAARQGTIPLEVLRASYERILALKAGL